MSLSGSSPWVPSDAPWLVKSSSDLSNLLSRVMAWRHEAGLSGSDSRYDQIIGCYGNPEAKIAFVAEIPEVIGIDEIIAKLRDDGGSVEELWKKNWNSSKGDKLFRKVLAKNDFIPEGTDDRPREWNCWITNFVKCPCRTHFWRYEMEKDRKEKILQRSAKFLNEEVRTISPRMVVMMGNDVESYFKTYASALEDLPKERRWVYHYAHKYGEKWERKYMRRFDEVSKEYWKMMKR